MGIEAGSLRELHLLHQQLRELRTQIVRGPKQLEARRQHLSNKQREFEVAREAVKRLRVTADQKDLELKRIEQKTQEAQRRLNEAKTNKEYQALRDQIDADKMAGSVLEDEILDHLAKIDERRSALAALEQEVQRAGQEVAKFEQTVGNEAERIAADIAQLENSLAESERSLSGDAADPYRRLVQARGADAMAAVDDGTCTGCFTGITPQMTTELLMHQLVFCKSCGRLLYLSK
jgi:hypothetical protein